MQRICCGTPWKAGGLHEFPCQMGRFVGDAQQRDVSEELCSALRRIRVTGGRLSNHKLGDAYVDGCVEPRIFAAV